MVPIATPKPIVDKINQWFAQIVSTEETKKFLADAGADPMINTPERAHRDVPDRDQGMGRIRPDGPDPQPM